MVLRANPGADKGETRTLSPDAPFIRQASLSFQGLHPRCLGSGELGVCSGNSIVYSVFDMA
jgi:hypothetical protein